jgi:ATP-binding cassette, subfamily A (ABC1), member 3
VGGLDLKMDMDQIR